MCILRSGAPRQRTPGFFLADFSGSYAVTSLLSNLPSDAASGFCQVAINKKYLFTPGPAPVPPEVLLEMARPIIHHRTIDFSKPVDQSRERLPPLFGTT